MRDGHRRIDTIGTYRQGNWYDCTNMDDGNIDGFLQFFYHRCTATSTGASGGSQYYTINVFAFKFLADSISKFFGIGY